MSVRIRVLIAALVTLFLPVAASAQQASAPSPVAGPRIETSATAFRLAPMWADSGTVLLQQRQNVGRPVALMVVGGAAILVGAVIGDAPGTLFMIGGAVALLYGLYQYLQ